MRILTPWKKSNKEIELSDSNGNNFSEIIDFPEAEVITEKGTTTSAKRKIESWQVLYIIRAILLLVIGLLYCFNFHEGYTRIYIILVVAILLSFIEIRKIIRDVLTKFFTELAKWAAIAIALSVFILFIANSFSIEQTIEQILSIIGR